ncbi:MAG TPA: DNA polymerase, partial [Mycobacteriales bacterium]|nr:DNA polymerase [Mycobacteriales bacterium]
WDLAAVSRLLYGGNRDDPGAIWAAAHGLDQPALQRGELDLLDLDDESDDVAVRPDGQLSRIWRSGGWSRNLETAVRWAELAIEVQRRQHVALTALPDPRGAAGRTPLAVLTAYAESAAALLAVELGESGLPVDRDVLAEILEPVIGPPPVDEAHAAARRRARDDVVRRHFPNATDIDLRNPAQVKEMLARFGLNLPDTRSWRLEPHSATSVPVAALLAWRKAERLSTTYGWSWLDRHIGDDGRLRGSWTAAEGAGRMTASAGLHNMPAELRPAVRAEPGHVLVRADLGQVEPRVLAVVSGDAALAQAARDEDMYAPVAARLGCDRPTAKVAVLAAMYGQTSGTAGNALRQMDRTYMQAMSYLRTAEEGGRNGTPLRTYGGRLLRMQPGWGRFARNAVVQGAAAELFKAWAATVRVGLPDGAQIVLCLHDELLVHARQEDADAVAQLLSDALAATARWWAAGSGVRFVAEVSTADSWADAH